MGLTKIISTNGFHVRGAAVTKVGYDATKVVRYEAQNDTIFSSGGYIGLRDSFPRSWSATGTTINTTGTLLFNNEINGGSLSNIILANRGTSTCYVGYNSELPYAPSGFPLATGESIKWENTIITEVWAITANNTTLIDAQGLFNQRQLER